MKLLLAPAPALVWRWVLVGAGFLQALGIVLFFGTMWTRIRTTREDG